MDLLLSVLPWLVRGWVLSCPSTHRSIHITSMRICLHHACTFVHMYAYIQICCHTVVTHRCMHVLASLNTQRRRSGDCRCCCYGVPARTVHTCAIKHTTQASQNVRVSVCVSACAGTPTATTWTRSYKTCVCLCVYLRVCVSECHHQGLSSAQTSDSTASLGTR